MNRILKQTGEFMVGLGILALLVYRIGFHEITSTFASIEIGYLLVMMLMTAIVLFVYPLSLIILYAPIKEDHLGLRQLFRLRMITQILGNLTPNKLGELLIFALIKRRYKVNQMPIFILFTLDKFTTVIHALAFSAVGFFFLFEDGNTTILFIGLAILCIFGVIMAPLFIRRLQKVVWTLFKMRRLDAMLKKISTFLGSFLRQHPQYVVCNLLLTTLSYFLTACVVKLAFLALNTDVSLTTIFFISNMVAVAALIPLNIPLFGIKELSGIYLYSLIGISAAVATQVVIATTVAKYLNYIVLYFIFSERGYT